MDQADAAHDRRLRSDIDGLAADVDVAVAQCLQHLRQCDAVVLQAVLVDVDIVGAGLAAPAGHIDDTRYRLEAPLQHPVLESLEVGDRVAGRPDHPVAVDLADRTGR